MQSISSNTQPGLLWLNYLRSVFDIFDKVPDINGTQYQIYQLQRPIAGLYQLKYLNLKITSNMRLIPPHLDQNANYHVTAHHSWHIYTALLWQKEASAFFVFCRKWENVLYVSLTFKNQLFLRSGIIFFSKVSHFHWKMKIHFCCHSNHVIPTCFLLPLYCLAILRRFQQQKRSKSTFYSVSDNKGHS